MVDQFLRHNQLALRALWLLERAQKRRSPRKLQAARSAFEQVLAEMSPDHPDRPACLANLGAALGMLYQRTGDASALDALLQLHDALVEFLPERHPNRIEYRHNLKDVVARLVTGTTDSGLLSRSVPLAREAALDRPTRGVFLEALRICLRERFELGADDHVLTELLAVGNEQVAATSADDPELPAMLAALSADQRDAALASGRTHLLDEALTTGRRAVKLCPEGHRDRAVCLGTLSNTLHAQFVHRDGALATLRESVAVARGAVALTADGDEHRPPCLNGLGIALRELYEATRDLDALKEAFTVCRETLTTTGIDHPSRATYLTNLSAAGQELYKRTGDREAIGLALTAAVQAVALSTPGSLRYAHRMSELGNVRHIMLQGPSMGLGSAPNTASEEDLSPEERARRLAWAQEQLRDSVEAAREAVRAGGGGDSLAGRLNNLSIAARTLFEFTGGTAALQEAVQSARKAATLTKPGTVGREGTLLTLVRALSRSVTTPDVVAEMRNCCAELAASGATPRAHVAAHFYFAEALMSADRPDPESALAAYETAVARLPEVAARRLLRPDREHGLAEFGELASGAAAAALSLGRPERALRLLEHARGLLLREAMGLRGADFDRLRTADPARAEKLLRLQHLLGASDQDSTDLYQDGVATTRGFGVRMDRHHALAERWERLLADIRGLPGLESFQRPPSLDDLSRRSPDGPVVLVNASRFRCDAVILGPAGSVRSLRLDCDHDELVRCAEVFQPPGPPGTTSPDVSSAQHEQRLLDALAWLWDHVVEPVLSELALLSPMPVSATAAPRVWWCPVGVAAFLPLHAAGRHASTVPTSPATPPPAAMDHVVSSYTATVGSLQPGLGQTTPTTDTGTSSVDVPSVLVVEAGQVPGATPLPGAHAEGQRIRELIPDATLLSGPRATRDAVLRSLPAHRIAHLACHAVTDPRSPALNRLLLHDHASAPLTSLELAGVSVPDGELAYLSACETSRSSRALANEALHIACAFQMVGYRHVIGTLWPIADGAARHIADDFYTGLAPSFRSDEAARSLHRAVNGLRSDAPLEPSHWAGHIHLGS